MRLKNVMSKLNYFIAWFGICHISMVSRLCIVAMDEEFHKQVVGMVETYQCHVNKNDVIHDFK